MYRTIIVSAILAVFAATVSAGEAAPAGKRWAVVIGIDDYQDLGKLTTARNDAKALAQTLIENGGYAENRVILLTDDAAESQNRPTMATLRKRIENTAAMTEAADTLFVFFSGHGIVSDGKGYLVPMDGDPKNAVSLDWVKDTLAKAKASSKVLILDACHAGSAAKGVGGIAPSLLAGTTNLVMLLSSAADQVSYPDEESGQSVFTRHLVAGLAGAADADGDKAVTVAELHAFVKRSMKDWCVASKKTQTPVVLPEAPPALVLTHCRPGARPRPPRPAAPEKGLTLDLGGGATLARALVPAGRFRMGSPAGEALRRGNETQHEVTISRPFYMGIQEVTRGQFAAFVRDSGHKTEAEKEGWSYALAGTNVTKVNGASWRNPGFEQTDRHPVVCVNWNDASAFCDWLSRKTGRKVRLPTEAEWEYACRAGTETAYQWGNNPDDGRGWYNAVDQMAKGRFPGCPPGFNNWSDGYVFTAPVGQFKPNAWGLYDMHGNVWEWCADWHGEYPVGAATDPTGPGSGQGGRVIRGGSWYNLPSNCRSADRYGVHPVGRDGFCVGGFRVVVSWAGVDLR